MGENLFGFVNRVKPASFIKYKGVVKEDGIGVNSSGMTLVPRAAPSTARGNPALACFKESYIVVSGGQCPQTHALLQSVDIYKIKANAWKPAPMLTIARKSHSSCCLGDYIYVACGQVSSMQVSG